MDKKNDFYTSGQLRRDLRQMLDFVNLQLSRTLAPEERAYFKGLKFYLEEICRLARHLWEAIQNDNQDPTQSPE